MNRTSTYKLTLLGITFFSVAVAVSVAIEMT